MTFKNSKTKKSTAKKFRCVVKPAEEKPPVADEAAKITAIKQDKASSFTATFSADVTGVTTGAMSIVRDDGKTVVTIKSITVDKNDKTKAAIETYEALTDGKAYTVTYKAADGTESSATFTATAGIVADIALNTYTIPANTPTEIKYQTIDADGVVIAEAGIGSNSNNVVVTVENVNGYQRGNNLLLYKTGDTATVKAVYHTYKYNTSGVEEGKVEKTLTVTAVDQSTVIETYDYTVADYKDENAIDFKRDTLVKQLAVDDDKNAAKDPYAFFSFRKADGTDITSSLDYTVSSGNENVLLASGTVAGGAKLTPVAVGATYLVIKNASGVVINTLPITVVAKRSLSAMTVDKSTVTIAKQIADSAGAQKITVAVMDQYSGSYEKFTYGQPLLRNSNSANNLSVTADQTGVKNDNEINIKINSQASEAKVGTYTYTLEVTDTEDSNNKKMISFTVIVSDVLSTTNNTLALVMMDNGGKVVSTVDTTVTDKAFEQIILKPTIVVKNNGSVIRKANTTSDVVSIGALSLTKNGVPVKDESHVIYGPVAESGTTNLSDPVVVVTTGSGVQADPIIKNLDPGTYTIQFTAILKDNSTRTMSTSFIVEDSQKEFAAKVEETSIPNTITNLQGVFENTDYVTFTYAGTKLEKTYKGWSYAYAGDGKADYTEVNASRISVNKVAMNVPLPGTGTTPRYVQMTATVNKTFTFGGTVSTPETIARAATAAAMAAHDLNVVTSSGINTVLTSTFSAITTTGVAITSGSSISISNVEILGDPSNSTNTSCAAISNAGITSGSAFITGTIEQNTKKVTLSLHPTSGTMDEPATGDKLVITLTITSEATYQGQPGTATGNYKLEFVWDASHKWNDPTVTKLS